MRRSSHSEDIAGNRERQSRRAHGLRRVGGGDRAAAQRRHGRSQCHGARHDAGRPGDAHSERANWTARGAGFRTGSAKSWSASRCANASLTPISATRMEFGKGSWKVVGVFDAGGIGVRVGSLGRREPDGVRLRPAGRIRFGVSAGDRSYRRRALKNRVSDDQRLKLEGMMENEYYAKQTSSGASDQVIGWRGWPSSWRLDPSLPP